MSNINNPEERLEEVGYLKYKEAVDLCAGDVCACLCFHYKSTYFYLWEFSTLDERRTMFNEIQGKVSKSIYDTGKLYVEDAEIAEVIHKTRVTQGLKEAVRAFGAIKPGMRKSSYYNKTGVIIIVSPLSSESSPLAGSNGNIEASASELSAILLYDSNVRVRTCFYQKEKCLYVWTFDTADELKGVYKKVVEFDNELEEGL